MKKFTQNKFLVILVGVLLLANLGVLLYFLAIKKEDKRDFSHKNPTEFVQKELGFTKDQSVEYETLRNRHMDSIRPYFDSMRKLKDSLYIYLQQPGTSDSVVSALSSRIGDKQSEIEMLTFHHFQRVRGICTGDQLQKFDTLVHKIINRGPGMRRGSDDHKKDKS
jgi:hypothetical protein